MGEFMKSIRLWLQMFGVIGNIAFLVLWIALLYGYILNIIAIYHSNFSTITGQLVLRVIGVFVWWIGGIMGLFV